MFIGVYNPSVLFSYIGLLFGVLSCHFCFQGNLKLSLFLFASIGIIDMLDGRFAALIKRTDFEKKFGIQIDTILDVFNFAALPFIILYAYGFNTSIDLLFLFIYSFCATMRLAYFNIMLECLNDSSIYFGFPTTTIALYLPLVILVHSATNTPMADWIARGMLFVISILYIINLKIIKPRSILFYLTMIIIGISILIGICFVL